MGWQKSPEYVKRKKVSKPIIFNTSIVADEIAEKQKAEQKKQEDEKARDRKFNKERRKP